MSADETPGHAAPRSRDRWWVLDRPLWRDWLTWLMLCAGIGNALVPLLGLRWYRTADNPTLSLAATMVVQFVIGVVVAGVVAGIVREFLRGRREAESGSPAREQ